MILAIPPDAIVIRRVRPGYKGPWHLLKKSPDNGFKKDPDFPEFDKWVGTKTHVSFCDVHMDERHQDHDGKIEFATVAEVKSICPSCYPYLSLPHDNGRNLTLGGADHNYPLPGISS